MAFPINSINIDHYSSDYDYILRFLNTPLQNSRHHSVQSYLNDPNIPAMQSILIRNFGESHHLVGQSILGDWNFARLDMPPELLPGYKIRVKRELLKDNPIQLLDDLIRQFSNEMRHRIHIIFEGESGIDNGGLSRQFIADLFSGIVDAMKCKACETGLYAPSLQLKENAFQPLNDADKKVYNQLGQLIMFCLNACENYPIGVLFDQSVFTALVELSGMDVCNQELDDKLFDSLFAVFSKMDSTLCKKVEAYLAPLQENTSDTLLLDAYAVVADDDAIEKRNLNNDVGKIRECYPAIQEAIRAHVMQWQIRPLFAPLFEIAKGMREAPFKSKLSYLEIKSMEPEVLAEKLQGRCTREMICEKLNFTSDIPEEKRGWFKNWIQTQEEAKIKQFLKAITGAPALGSKQLFIQNTSDIISFHTCSNSLHIPMDIIDSEELLFLQLTGSADCSNFSVV